LAFGAAALAALVVWGPRLLVSFAARGASSSAGAAGIARGQLADAGPLAPAKAPATLPATHPATQPASAPTTRPAPAPRPPAPAPRPPNHAHRPAPPSPTQPGFFTIDSKPYATIFVDGKKVGETPLFRIKLAPGRRRVMAVLGSGKSQTFTVTIVPGRQAPPRRLQW